MSSEQFNIVDFYDIENTVSVINRENVKKVALQFPDSLLMDADKVTSALRSQLSDEIELYILGDTTVCPCCVDTVAVEHIKADLVIHYGDACMSQVEDIPVYYAFGQSSIDIDSCVQAIRERFGGSKKTLYLCYDLSYHYCIQTIFNELKEYCPSILVGEVKRSQNLSSSEVFTEEYCKLGYHYFKTSAIDPNGVLVFIGKDGLTYSNYYENSNVYSILVDSGFTQAFVYADYQLQTISLNRFLMQRYVQIERFEHLEMIGIIVGTLSVNRYREMIRHMSALAETHDQTLYTFMVGKLNLPKLANFPGMEGFILIGCERSCFVDTREYPFPIITPYEYEVSLKEHEWESIYIRDYTKLLGDVVEEAEEEVTESVDESNCQIIAFQSPLLEYINEQHYHGLEQKGDVSIPAVLKMGQKGIPSCYENELFLSVFSNN